MQPAMAAGPYSRVPQLMDEDCLTLDVTAPADARNAPVMVWIHGGTLIWGTAQSKMYDGREFAKRGVVLVSINYRLGVLGYLAHPEISRESADRLSGNYGLLDQIAATEDVDKQRAAFAQLDKLWTEQLPVAPLFFLPNFSAYSDRVAGELPNAQGKPDPTSMYFRK